MWRWAAENFKLVLQKRHHWVGRERAIGSLVMRFPGILAVRKECERLHQAPNLLGHLRVKAAATAKVVATTTWGVGEVESRGSSQLARVSDKVWRFATVAEGIPVPWFDV
jgi:hypothetical protein